MNDYFLSNEFRAPHKVWPNENYFTYKRNHIPDLEELKSIRLLPEFDELNSLGNNRLILAAFRYSLHHDPFNYNCRIEIKKRLSLYEETFNIEHLVDCYNFVRLEFFRAKTLGFNFKSIDDGYHAKPIN